MDGIESGIHPEGFAYVTEGLIVTELPNGDIEVRRYDTYRNEEIAADNRWVIKAPFGKALYGGGNAPVFADNADLSLAVSAYSVKVTFPKATDDDCVFRYAVNVYNVASGATEGKASIFSRFYLNSEMPDKCILRISSVLLISFCDGLLPPVDKDGNLF